VHTIKSTRVTSGNRINETTLTPKTDDIENTTNGKQSTWSTGSNGWGHRKTAKLPTTDKECKTQGHVEQITGQWIWMAGKWEIKGTNTIQFIHKQMIPHKQMKDVTYGNFVCSIWPKKAETHRSQFTVGSNRINYPGEVATPTAEMLVEKLLFSSFISTKGAHFMAMDISNFYLMTPLHWPKYIKIKLSDIPEEIIIKYKLHKLATPDSNVYIMANKVMYGIPQAGLLANELLEKTT
jgi:hypothetical protein